MYAVVTTIFVVNSPKVTIALWCAMIAAFARQGGWGQLDMSVDYTQYCPVARTLEVIGDRWTILILRDLIIDGPRRFIDFQQSFPRIGPSTLSDRLKSLEEHGIIERSFYEEHPPRAQYLLTAKGEDLRPVLRALRVWGDKHTNAPRG
jgi:DNA-binding HxlR family transcriptional regulator